MTKLFVSLCITARLYLLVIPFSLFLIGAGSNQAVLIANGGKFPVMVNDREAATNFLTDKNGYMDDAHCRMTGETKLNWLADYITLRGPFGLSIKSPGDLLVDLGVFLAGPARIAWFVLTVSEIFYLKRRLGTIYSHNL